MTNLTKDFYHRFKMSREQVKKEMEEFGGTLENFYHYCDKAIWNKTTKITNTRKTKKSYMKVSHEAPIPYMRQVRGI